MRLLGNIIWFLFGGVFMGLAWCFFGLFALVSIVGIPWAKACFVIAQFTFFPFGKEAISRKTLHQKEDIGTGTWGLIGNILWFIFAGFWLAIGHIMSAFACAITIIGIPFAIQHVKLAIISLAPIGMSVIDTETAEILRQRDVNERQNR
ncbi:YccF domain-containing protein [Sulfurospirillum sp. MES]|uniref:YccF domain-containing protein n=1 Tax=Sulfurospirillum sp. MES TaxID=1565314 RepID=UPI00054415CA|nr:YccF domain-containing protein [Sulfurospirillum sp. MES]KHG33196.1 MAG: membrane protein [Sulfurospirillum sp. MES]